MGDLIAWAIIIGFALYMGAAVSDNLKDHAAHAPEREADRIEKMRREVAFIDEQARRQRARERAEDREFEQQQNGRY